MKTENDLIKSSSSFEILKKYEDKNIFHGLLKSLNIKVDNLIIKYKMDNL